MRQIIASFLVFSLPAIGLAHFPFLAIEDSGEAARLHGYFGHGAEPTDVKYFSRLQNGTLLQVPAQGEPIKLAFQPGKDSVATKITLQQPAAFTFEKNQGLSTRHGNYLSQTCAKTYSEPAAWTIDTRQQLQLDLVPQTQGDTLQLTAYWKEKPLASAEIVVENGDNTIEGKTDSEGRFVVSTPLQGRTTARVTHILEQPGEYNGAQYDGQRTVTTLLIDLPSK